MEVDFSDLEPDLSLMTASREVVARAVEKAKESTVFKALGVQELKDCSCGHCRDRDGERPPYCCYDLWKQGQFLSIHGKKLRDGLMRVAGIESYPVSCITQSDSFVKTFLDERVRNISNNS